jgi:hypothetical protein
MNGRWRLESKLYSKMKIITPVVSLKMVIGNVQTSGNLDLD